MNADRSPAVGDTDEQINTLQYGSKVIKARPAPGKKGKGIGG